MVVGHFHDLKGTLQFRLETHMQDDTSNESGDNNPSRLRILFSRGLSISITEDFGNNEDAQKHLDCPTNKHLAKIAGLKFIVLST